MICVWGGFAIAAIYPIARALQEVGSAVRSIIGVRSVDLLFREERMQAVSDPSHRIVFHYTPKHCSWMNQIEIWLSSLVRKLLKRGSFTSGADLQTKGVRLH